MSDQQKLVPKLRFPEFVKAGEWSLKPFSKFIKLFRGSSPRPIREYLTQNDKGVNWIKIGDTSKASNYVIRSVSEKITPEGAKKSRFVKKGELILANSMSYGYTYQLALEGCIYDGWFVLREYEEVFDKQFLLQLLNSSHMQEQYKKFAAGGIVQNISSEIVYSTLIPKIKIKEQQKIAACLSSLDQLISAHQDKLETLKDHKKGLLQNLFPQDGQKVPHYRFSEFKKDGDWVGSKLGDKEVSGFVNNKIDSKKLSLDNYVSTDNMLPDFLGITRASKLPSTDRVTEFVEGDILISNIRPYLKKVWKADRNGGASNDVLIFRAGKSVDKEFLETVLKNDRFINYVMQSAKGVKMPRGDKDSMLNYPTRIPDSIEQQKIAKCLNYVDELISELAYKIDQLQQHKKGLMQGLFPQMDDAL